MLFTPLSLGPLRKYLKPTSLVPIISRMKLGFGPLHGSSHVFRLSAMPPGGVYACVNAVGGAGPMPLMCHCGLGGAFQGRTYGNEGGSKMGKMCGFSPSDRAIDRAR